MTTSSNLDPKGLIKEAYNIDGITEEQCRSIFLDWALSLPDGVDSRAALKELLAQYQDVQPVHFMTAVLSAGLTEQGRPKRRGGWRSRPR